MARMPSWAKRMCFTVVCCVALPTPAQAQQADARSGAAAPTEVTNAEIALPMRWSQSMLDQYLALPPDWPLSAGLRAQAQEAIAEARPRLSATLRDWARELQLQPASGPPGISASEREQDLYLGLANRIDNERALNILDSAGDAHEAWRAEVAAVAGWCGRLRAPPRWAEVLLQIDRLPEPARAAALQHERQLLARWGLPRPAVPARPAFSLDAHAALLLTRVWGSRPDQRPPVAMVPVVAFTLLKDKAPPLAGSSLVAPPGRDIRCAGLQWALANARAESAADNAELNVAFRYALMFRAEDTTRRASQQGAAASDAYAIDYPAHIRRLGVTGKVQVQVVRDAADRITEARVLSRELSAPGLQDRRPVFIETALDEPSITRARAMPSQGPGARTVAFNWKLQ
jgi:hypothetical protein